MYNLFARVAGKIVATFIAPLFQASAVSKQRIRKVRDMLSAAKGEAIDLLIPSVIGDIPLLVRAIANEWEPLELRVDATWALSNMLTGNTTNTRHIVVNKGVLSTLLEHATVSPKSPPLLAKQCTWALGNIVADCAELRELLALRDVVGIVSKSIEGILDGPSEEFDEHALENALWVLSSSCVGPYNSVFQYEAVLDTVMKVMRAPQAQTFKLKYRISCILNSLTAPDIEAGIADALVDRGAHVSLIRDYLIARASRRTMLNALKVLGFISYEFNPAYTRHLVDAGVLEALKVILDGDVATHGAEVVSIAIWLLSNIVADEEHVGRFLSSGLAKCVHTVYDTCAAEEEIRMECAYCSANAIVNNSSRARHQALREAGLLRVVFETFKHDQTPPELYESCAKAIEAMAAL